MAEKSTNQQDAAETFEQITLEEFDLKMTLARSWLQLRKMHLYFTIVIGFILVFVIIIHDNRFWARLLAASYIITSIATGVSLNLYITHHFKLYCPFCKRTLLVDFEAFKSSLHNKNRSPGRLNPFVNGQCRKCKHHIIEIDQAKNSSSLQ